MGITTSKFAAAGDRGGKSTSSSAIVSETATETGSVTIQVAGYSRTKGLGVGKSINSCKFHVGGHSWYVAYYPDGDRQEFADWISVFLYLDRPVAADDVVTAELVFSLLDGNGDTVHMKITPWPVTFSFVHGYKQRWGYGKFIKRKNMESRLWSCLRLGGERFGIRCDIDVVTRGRRRREEAAAAASSTVVVPPPDLHRHLADLLASGVGADVHFMVGDKLFRAHRNVLAARSPVFMAKLFSGLGEETGAAACIQVDDMDPSVFRVMLQFIYTDILPYIDEGDITRMAQHLLVAARRYKIERLKLICEDMLHKGIDATTVGTSMMHAKQY